MKLGDWLLSKGKITQEQLDRALHDHGFFGGRLGTNLVELGYLRLDELEKHLSEHLRIPVPPAQWLERPSGPPGIRPKRFLRQPVVPI